jgi:hypothetical protein
MTWRSCPALDSPDACGQLPHPPVATPRRVDVPERTSDRTSAGPYAGHTPSIIMSRRLSADPDKAGRHAPYPNHDLYQSNTEAAMT